MLYVALLVHFLEFRLASLFLAWLYNDIFSLILKKQSFKQSLIGIFFLLVTGCGAFDSGRPWQDGPFALLWIDTQNEVTLSIDRGQGGWSVLVPEQVFAVGSDSKWIVAKQHPHGDRGQTQYWFVEKAEPQQVMGPYSKQDFEQLVVLKKLPQFTKTLDSLE